VPDTQSDAIVFDSKEGADHPRAVLFLFVSVTPLSEPPLRRVS
jgi:hypothetical protein